MSTSVFAQIVPLFGVCCFYLNLKKNFQSNEVNFTGMSQSEKTKKEKNTTNPFRIGNIMELYSSPLLIIRFFAKKKPSDINLKNAFDLSDITPPLFTKRKKKH